MFRQRAIEVIEEAFRVNPVVAILGPRQCGKTTLARQFLKKSKVSSHFFDLENPDDLAALDNPQLLFASLTGTLVIDEVQRRPELFTDLRVLVDSEKRQRKILLLGSASRDLIRQSSETLAGRISYLELTPFTLGELSNTDKDVLWLRGGFPLSFLAIGDRESYQWRKAYISTFLERDIPALGFRIPAATLRRFWQMLSHYHGQVINYSEMGRSFAVADTTIRHYLDILTETFMVRQLQPWHENLGKRQVKRPKIYFRDSGLYHALLTVETQRQLLSHPKLGASWEGFALEQVIRHFDIEAEEAYFWAVHGEGELDLFFHKGGKRYGVEFKFADAPELTRSMTYAKQHLQLDNLFCVYPGHKRFPLAERIEACGLGQLPLI